MERLTSAATGRVGASSITADTRSTSMIHANAATTVGRTPLVELSPLARGLGARIVGNLEMRKPAGSVKDRLGVELIQDAERRGALRPGMTVVEATGGNTGIGLAFAAAIRGYRLILTMPDSMSRERVALLRQYGAEVILTPGTLMADTVALAKEITERTPDPPLSKIVTDEHFRAKHITTVADSIALWKRS